jgi:hypothetical protein
MNTLSGIGMSFVGIFIPIYLLEVGFPITSVIIWLIIHHSSLLFGAFLSVYVSNVIGLVRCWYIRVILLLTLFIGLYLLPDNNSLLFILGIISGLESAFFWIPYNILTVRKTSHDSMGSSLAKISNISSIVGLFIPFIAALIIMKIGYTALFAFAFIFILVSLIPVLALTSEKTNFSFNRRAVMEIIKVNKHFILPEIFDNLGQDAGIIWSLFIFITGLTVLDLGLLGVISGVIGIVVTHFTGYLIDKWDKNKIIRLGAILTTITWITSYFIAVYYPTPFMLYLITALRGFAIGIFAMSYGAVMMNRARIHDSQFLVLREIPTILGRLIVFSLAILFIYIDKFELIFLLVALLSTYFWFNNNRLLTKSA